MHAGDRVHVCTTFMGALAARGVRAGDSVDVGDVSRRDDQVAGGTGIRLVPHRQVASLSRVKNQRLLIDAPVVREKVNAHVDLIGEDAPRR